MDSRTAGFVVAAIGVAVVLAGLLVAAGALSWFGRLPGDIRWSSGNTRVYVVPITTMIVLSLVLTLTSYFARRFF